MRTSYDWSLRDGDIGGKFNVAGELDGSAIGLSSKLRIKEDITFFYGNRQPWSAFLSDMELSPGQMEGRLSAEQDLSYYQTSIRSLKKELFSIIDGNLSPNDQKTALLDAVKNSKTSKMPGKFGIQLLAVVNKGLPADDLKKSNQ